MREKRSKIPNNLNIKTVTFSGGVLGQTSFSAHRHTKEKARGDEQIENC
jgi:hypothetical protein